MRRTLIAGNWKMHGSLAGNASLLDGITSGIRNQDRDVVVCVPSPFFAQCKDVLTNSAIAWGGQDLSQHEVGAYTGEVSASMLCEFGCTYVIVGHSERRTYHGESDDLVMRKTVRALQAGLTPIVCVGETSEQRERGETESVVVCQLAAVLDGLDAAAIADIVIAYEPVWAIGTGQAPTPEMAQKVHEMLRASLVGCSPEAAAAVRILYGGSMKPENASGLLAMPDIDGGLIGGAALNAADFLAIVHAA